MLKMTESSVQSRQVSQFEDLFVQRHNNVSILYADIVNFTPLSGNYNISSSIQLTSINIEKLSSHDLVATLNQLFRLRAQSYHRTD